ncbi:MAG: hypothetical protein SAJ12_17605 [Jaaginema sp. PMC 1079.18]|nr:hypothetical protein [Jaaginema sp. PMC 1080.18]MEC4852798.1 hypothetical protein [Jaaginema sp. PMC 1079.18]MEC4867785.1 hypothetical protein [Jaaginema sp. PMC 1078.18]
MSQRDGFTGGFVAGALIGGLVGGLVGALVTRGRAAPPESEDPLLEVDPEQAEARIEDARRSLEAKIAQLNLAIDDVRQQLGSVNGNSTEIESEMRDRSY